MQDEQTSTTAAAGPVLSEGLGRLPEPCSMSMVARSSDFRYTADDMRAYAKTIAGAAAAEVDREWYAKLQAADARVAELTKALREVLEFQSAKDWPTIHDWGRWRRVADDRPNVRVQPRSAAQQE